MCKVLENRAQQDEERMDQLTAQLKEARLLAEDADNKSDEVSRKLAFVEDELEVAEDRVKGGDAKIMELEEELKVVGNSLKSLEVSEEKANQRVEEFKKQLKTLTVKLKEAEARAEYAEKTVKKLQKEVDRLEGTFLNNFIRVAAQNFDRHFNAGLLTAFCFLQILCFAKKLNILELSMISTRHSLRFPLLAQTNNCFTLLLLFLVTYLHIYKFTKNTFLFLFLLF